MNLLLMGAVFAMPFVAALSLLAQMQVAVVPGDRFGWEQTGPSLEMVRSYRYEIELDGQQQKALLTGVKCEMGIVSSFAGAPVPSGAYDCTAPIPVAIGQHMIRVRAVDNTVPGVAVVDGGWSPAFVYLMRPPPTAPSKLRVVKPKP